MKWSEEERVAVFSLEYSNSRELSTFEIIEDDSEQSQQSESTDSEEDSVSNIVEPDTNGL
jgi:hypothetical protein